MPIGGLLRDRDSQYVSHRDESGTWRILNAWHDGLSDYEPDADIPDDHDAVTMLSEGGYHSLIREAARLGILAGAANAENFSLRELCDELENKVEQLENEIEASKIENERREPVTSTEPARLPDNVSESYLLKESALQAIIKLTALDEVSSLTKPKQLED